MTTKAVAGKYVDAVLVAAAAGGDAGAWRELVDRYAQLVWDVVRARGLGEAIAADVCVLTWLRCADHLDELADGSDLGGWLTTVARREASDVLQRRAASAAAPTDAVQGVSGPTLAPAGTPGERLRRRPA
jgi:DNA-directed RNA polymerase specialized sigma24 family protein